MATLQKIPPLIDRFAMDDKLNMLADGVNNLVDGFGPYLDKAIDAAQDAEQAAQDATNAAQNVQSAIDGANTATEAANAAADAANTAADTANEAANAASAAAGSATSAAGAANEAASAANVAAEAANKAAQTANTAANNADEAVAGIDDKVQEAVDERVLAKQYGPASVISASGVCENVPVAGMKVYGSTRQNLWTKLSGSSNGVSVSTEDDGAITLSGTASAVATVAVRVYNLQPGKSYAFSVDKAIPGVGNGYGFYIDTDAQAAYYIGNSSHLNRTYTLDSEATEVTIGLYLPAGVTVSGTYRVMLNEGSEAQPWCPPGLTSVSELDVVTAGKNLLPVDASEWEKTNNTTVSIDGDIVTVSSSSGVYTGAGVSMNFLAGKTVYFGRESASGGYAAMQLIYAVDDVDKYVVYDDSPHFVPSYATNIRIILYCNNSSNDGAYTTVFTMPYLRIDGVAEYAPLSGFTATTIDLDGHELRSLPDGTYDVLSVDGSGAAVLEQAVKDVFPTIRVAPASVWHKSSAVNGFYTTVAPEVILAPSGNNTNLMCDKLPILTREEYFSGKTGILRDSTWCFCVPESIATDANGFVEWLAQQDMCIIGELIKHQTVSLDPVDPPTVPAADTTLWASSNVTAEIEASLWEPFAEEGGMQQKALIEVAKAAAQAGLITVKETVMRWSSNEYPLYIFNMKALNKAIYVGIATRDSFANNMYTSPNIPYFAEITPLSGIITGAVQVPSKSDTGIYDYPAISGYIENRRTQQGYAGYSSVNGYAWDDTTIQKGWCMIFGECKLTD